MDRNIGSQNRALRRALRAGERHLSDSCETMAAWIGRFGKCELQVDWDRSLYEALVRAVAHQQLHGNAAASILKRLCSEFKRPFPTPRQIARAPIERLRGCGLSQAKATAVQGIAAATLTSKIPSREEAESMDDEALIEQLVVLRGVGRWTIEMLLIFTLGRLDVMPVDDYGVRTGLQRMFSLPELPKKAEFARLTSAWQPYRSLGAWYLWRYAEFRE